MFIEPYDHIDRQGFCPVLWPRAIALVDMNAFFASVEQLDHPEWRGRPVGVTNGLQGTCIITCSYEARALGICTGMRVKHARQLCGDFIQVPARPVRYAAVSTAIMRALHDISPDVEVFSVDEAFLDITRCQRLLGTPLRIGHMIKQKVFEASQLKCSVGVSGDKTTAKYAAKLHKPDGMTVIAPWDAAARLHDVPVTELCGISHGIGTFLANYGVHNCGDMHKLPISVLAQRFGNPGRRIWYMCQGQDPDKLQLQVPPPKSIGHGKVMPPNTTDRSVLLMYLKHMAEKVAARLRKHALQATQFSIGLLANFGWLGNKYRSAATNDGKTITQLCQRMLKECWDGEGISQVQITALDPLPANLQLDLFQEHDEKQAQVNAAMDKVNTRYGEFTLAPARLLNRSDMPNVISPAWKPDGHRQTIEPES
jgi:DNA polymerase-4